MAYQSLYRRYRPRRFDEVRGQNHVVGALRNAIRNDSVTHAYLFSGPRGTGKTSTARILAKALNCENLQNGEPCCDCTPCQDMEAGRSFDLFELDAASNNGVDAIRDLIERAAVGSPGRTKVYILDEVHMLSPAAANALLKTLEEPPDHVRFVLATTDPQKVLPTIRSRTQHFEFQLLAADELERYVRWISDDAQLDIDDAAVAWAVKQGRGSARDTLSALDQVVAAGGVVDRSEPVEKLLEALAGKDSGTAILAVADALDQGHDVRVLAKVFLDNLRDTFLVSLGADVPHMMADDVEATRTWAGKLGTPLLTRAMEAVGSSMVDMRQAADPRVPFEVALVRLTTPAAGSLSELSERIGKLEAAVAAGSSGTVAVSATTPRDVTQRDAKAGETPGGGAKSAAGETPGGGAKSDDVGSLSGPARARAELARQREERAGRGDDAASKSAPGRPTDVRQSRPASSPPPVPPSAASRRKRSVDGDVAQSGDSEPPNSSMTVSTQEPTDSSGMRDAEPTTVSKSGESAEPREASNPTDIVDLGDSPRPTDSADSTDAHVPTDAAETAGSTDDNSHGVGQLQNALETAVLPNIRGVAKAIYTQGRFVSFTGGVGVFAVENAPTRDRAEKSVSEVEGLLSTQLGQPISIQVVDSEGAARLTGEGPPGGDSATNQRGAATLRSDGTLDGRASGSDPVEGFDGSHSADDDEELLAINVDDLDDAKGIAETGLDRLIKAFPGASLVDTKEEQT